MLNKIRNRDVLYICLFALFSIVLVIPFIRTGKLVADVDWLFHASRVEQIYLNLKRGTLINFIATDTFQHTGSGSFLFYPYVFLYPWALLRLIFNPITSFYIWKALMTFLSFLIAFYCMKGFSKNKIMSFIFAIVYVLNTYRLYLGFYVFGEYVASAFLPLVFYGFYIMFFKPIHNDQDNNRSIIVLGIGMSLLIYSHLVSVVITLETFILILAIYSLAGNLGSVLLRWRNVLKSILLTILLCLPLFFLFAHDYLGKSITSTKLGIMLNLVQPLTLIINSSVDSLINANSIGLFLIIACLFGWAFLGKVENSKLYISIYLLGAFFLVLASSSFPWYLFSHSILKVVQMPYRYLEFSSFFFSIIFAKLSSLLLTKKLNLQNSFIVLGISVITLFGYCVPVQKIYTELKTSSPTQFSQVADDDAFSRSILDKHNYNKQFNYRIRWGETDYFPKKSILKSNSIIKGITYAKGQRLTRIQAKYLPNSIIYKVDLPSSCNLDLPCIVYHDTYVKANGKSINYAVSDRGTVLIPKSQIQSGKTNIEIGFNPGIIYYLWITVTICTWVVILALYIRKMNNI